METGEVKVNAAGVLSYLHTEFRAIRDDTSIIIGDNKRLAS
jgi:hypothetical protein